MRFGRGPGTGGHHRWLWLLEDSVGRGAWVPNADAPATIPAAQASQFSDRRSCGANLQAPPTIKALTMNQRLF